MVLTLRTLPPSKDFVWNGADEGERLATATELQDGVTTAQVVIRFERDVLSAFRAAGPGWQTRMNEALRDWLRAHSGV